MSEDKTYQLFKIAKELNIGLATAADFLRGKGETIDPKPTAKINGKQYDLLMSEFQSDKKIKEEASQIHIGKTRRDEVSMEEELAPKPSAKDTEQEEILIKGVTTTSPISPKTEPVAPKIETAPVEEKKPEVVAEEPKVEEKSGPKIIGKIDLDSINTKTRPDKKSVKPVENKPTPVVSEKPKPEPVKEETAKLEVPPAEIPKVAPEPPKQVVHEPIKETPKPAAATEANLPPELYRSKSQKLSGPNIIGKIELPAARKATPVASSSGQPDASKRKRKRKDNPRPDRPQQQQQGGGQQGGSAPRTDNRGPRPDNRHKPVAKEEPTEKEIQDQIKATLARLSGAGKSGKFADRSKFRRQKRDDVASATEDALAEKELQSKTLKVTEFVTANELAKMMDVSVTQIISTCMSLGLFVSINQRLDAETLTIVADEFGYKVEFVTADNQDLFEDEQDIEEDLEYRAPIITVMGHVDHGKTSLLDYIRKTNVISGEAGGITQHIGAYEVFLENGKKIAFLDTPGHEAFTAMRARGAKVTDIVIIVVSADDSVMPQTVEAINHAQAAGVPLVFAINKIDKEGANPERIKEQLANMNILVEDWGGKYQCQEISAKSGFNVDLLLEKVLLEAELLELKANPNKRAVGTVIEAALDKGRGIVTTILVQAGTLRVGDPILAGSYSGRVKALQNDLGKKIEFAGPSTPVQVLGFTGAPQAGDKFNAMASEPEAREIANKRLQLIREQGLRTQKHITLDEIGRRLAIGNFKELNIIVKGDVDGSVEALADSLLKLSTSEIQVNIVHKAVGQISESDVLLATASDAIIIGFQVRPSLGARKIAEQEEIDIRLYSIIYDAINEIKLAMEGMLAPEIEEKIICNVEIREVFKITKVGTIAGCMVLDGKITRNTKIRIVRNGVVVYTGELASLKRFKDDVKEVLSGYECGLNIQNFNDIKVGDIVEGYEQVEVKRKLTT